MPVSSLRYVSIGKHLFVTFLSLHLLGSRVKMTCSDFSYSSNSEFVRVFFCGLTLASEQTRAGCVEAKKMGYAIESLFGFIQTVSLPAYKIAKWLWQITQSATKVEGLTAACSLHTFCVEPDDYLFMNFFGAF